MALKASGYRIINSALTTLISRKHVIGFDLDTAKSMTDAASTITSGQQFIDIFLWETLSRHASSRLSILGLS